MKESEKEKSALNKFEKYEVSPFLEDILKIKTRNKTIMVGQKAIPLASLETGEIEHIGFIGIKQNVDKEEFVKIFKAELRALFDLSKRSMRLLSYFMQIARINDDKAYFNMRECKKFTGYSSNFSIQLALTELLKKNFIAKTDAQNQYFINPSIFFNGNRMVIIREYFTKTKKELENESGNNANILSENNLNSNPNN